MKTGKVCIICPILLTIYGGEIYGSSDQAVLNVEAQYAKDSVLILYDTDDNLRIYSTSGAVGPSDGMFLRSTELVGHACANPCPNPKS